MSSAFFSTFQGYSLLQMSSIVWLSAGVYDEWTEIKMEVLMSSIAWLSAGVYDEWTEIKMEVLNTQMSFVNYNQ
jgi:hypothetical protein